MNLNHFLLEKFEAYDRRIALEYTKDGQKATLTYRDLKAKALRVVNFLFGLEPQDRTLIWSQNRVEWVWTSLGILLGGGIHSAIKPDATDEEAIHILKDLDPKFIFVENQQQLDLVTRIKDQLPSFEKVLVYEEVEQQADWIAPFSWLFDFKTRPEAFGTIHEVAELNKEDDTAAILYTKGRTNSPKGVLLSHKNILSSVTALNKHFEKQMTGMTRQLCVSSLSGILPFMADLYFIFASGRTLVLAPPSIADQSYIELKPNVVFANPGYYDQLRETIVDQFSAKSKFSWAIEIGKQIREIQYEKKSIPAMLGVKHNLAKKLILNKIQQKFGDRLRFLISGGDPIPKETAEFLRACGLNILHAYVLTEACGIVSCNLPGRKELSCIGAILSGLEIKVEDSGLLALKGASMSSGYWNQAPFATSNSYTKDGYFITDDAGQVIEGNILELG